MHHHLSQEASKEKKIYHQYYWTLPQEQAYALLEHLEEASLFEHGESPELSWQVTYLDHQNKGLPPLPQDFPLPVVEILNHEDWVARYQKDLIPLSLGDFYIHTPHHPASSEHKFSLRLEAAMAFGSGHHETTQGCLLALQDLFVQEPWHHALDWGCGSGILALALNALIPHSAVAMDNDLEAVEIAEKNAQLNQMTLKAFWGETLKDAEKACPHIEKFDLIVANLFSYLLIELAPQMTSAKHLILSGTLLEQEDEVLHAFFPLGWRLSRRYPLGQWVTLWLRR